MVSVSPQFKMISRVDLEELTGLSRSTIYDRLNPKSKRYDPSFPKPLRLGESAIGWQLSEILIWIGDRQPVISNMQHKD